MDQGQSRHFKLAPKFTLSRRSVCLLVLFCFFKISCWKIIILHWGMERASLSSLKSVLPWKKGPDCLEWQTTNNTNVFIHLNISRNKRVLLLSFQNFVSVQHTVTWMWKPQLYECVVVSFLYVFGKIKEKFAQIWTNNAMKGEWNRWRCRGGMSIVNKLLLS